MAVPLTIAIDGPVGAGKSSLSDIVAQRLDILHLDTGAMYRAVGYFALLKGIDTSDEIAVVSLLAHFSLQVCYEGGRQKTLINHQDVSALIRTDDVSMAASNVSKWSGVRAAMVALQREYAQGQSMLLDGRDIGTVVLPDATVKIYLTASPQVRAYRRYLELMRKGFTDSYDQVLADLLRRDEQDTTRVNDPLRMASDAVQVDTTDLSFEQSVERIIEVVEEARWVN